MKTTFMDDLGNPVDIRSAARIVSLVPSLTEALAVSARDRLVGVTDWCVQPADLDVRRIGGTKNPDVASIVAIDPDLVIANDEENRRVDLDAMRTAGLAVWVTDIRTVAGAIESIDRLLTAIEAPERDWLEEARAVWREPPQVGPARLRAVVPIWRRPWMHVGRDTYAGDVLARLGVDNVLAGHPDRYPRLRLEDLPPFDLVVLPDEPYAFHADDGPESFPGRPVALVSGRHLTWYGPAMVDAPGGLVPELAAALGSRNIPSTRPVQ